MYDKQQFDRCFFNPLEKQLLTTYPKLQELLPEEYPDGEVLAEDPESLLRYVIALYDPKSPVIKDNPDMTARKKVAAELAGYDQSDTTLIGRLYSCDSEYMVGVIVAFLRRIVQSRTWASIQADEQVFWEFVARLYKPITEESDKDGVAAVERKIKLSQGRETLSTQIEANWNKLLGDDVELKKKVKKQDYSPEAMAGIV